MDVSHSNFVQVRGLTEKINKLRRVDYTKFISKDDPSRLNKNIATDVDSFILPTTLLYNTAKQAHDDIMFSDIKIPQADLRARSHGLVDYKDKEFITVYWKSPVRGITGNVFICPMITTASFKGSKTDLPVLIPLKSPYYLASNESNKKNVLLCPGAFRFTKLKINGINYKVAVYTPIEQKNFLLMCQEENFYLPALSYRWNTSDSDNVLPYLIDFHTRRVQRGYYAPEDSLEHQVFLEHGSDFKDSSYYERLKDNEEVDRTMLPFFEYPSHVNIKLYARSCFTQDEGQLAAPLFLSIMPEDDYTREVYVDLRVLDLNFIWAEKTRSKDTDLPDESYYALSDFDTTYLEYSTHDPASLVAVYGYVNGNKISIEE
jgi:hypothetical protein